MAESATSVTLTISRNSSNKCAFSVGWATSDGSATSGQDYTSSGSTLAFSTTENSKQISIPILGGDAVEPTETFNVDITLNTTCTSAMKAGNTHTVVTITDDDDDDADGVADGDDDCDATAATDTDVDANGCSLEQRTTTLTMTVTVDGQDYPHSYNIAFSCADGTFAGTGSPPEGEVIEGALTATTVSFTSTYPPEAPPGDYSYTITDAVVDALSYEGSLVDSYGSYPAVGAFGAIPGCLTA